MIFTARWVDKSVMNEKLPCIWGGIGICFNQQCLVHDWMSTPPGIVYYDIGFSQVVYHMHIGIFCICKISIRNTICLLIMPKNLNRWPC